MSTPKVAPEDLVVAMEQDLQRYLQSVMQAVNDAHDPAALIATIATCTRAVREAVNEEAALLFSKKALDLLAD